MAGRRNPAASPQDGRWLGASPVAACMRNPSDRGCTGTPWRRCAWRDVRVGWCWPRIPFRRHCSSTCRCCDVAWYAPYSRSDRQLSFHTSGSGSSAVVAGRQWQTKTARGDDWRRFAEAWRQQNYRRIVTKSCCPEKSAKTVVQRMLAEWRMARQL